MIEIVHPLNILAREMPTVLAGIGMIILLVIAAGCMVSRR